MTREEKIELLNKLLEIEEKNDIGNLTRAERREFQQWVEALEQEPKIGHWIDDTRLGYHVSVCSNCNWRGHGDTCLIYKPKYCPNCGSYMYGVEPQERSDKE